MPGIMLELDTEQKALLAERDGYINVMWPRIDELSMPADQDRARMLIGWAALIGVAALFGGLAWRERGFAGSLEHSASSPR